jgi:hypothetical protein
MSVVDMEHLLNKVYAQQAHVLKSLEERYTGRPIYEEPLSFNTERGEMKRSRAVKAAKKDVELEDELDGEGKPKMWIQEAVKGMKKGAFTKQALRHDETPEEFAKDVLKHPGKYSKTTKKRAQFLKNITGKGSEVKMPKKDYMAEHHSLIKMLEEVSKKTGKEAKKQSKEIKGKGKKCINNIAGGCGMCGGSDGEIVLKKGGSQERQTGQPRQPRRQPPPPRRQRQQSPSIPPPAPPPSSPTNSPQHTRGQMSPAELAQLLERVRIEREQDEPEQQGGRRKRRKH